MTIDNNDKLLTEKDLVLLAESTAPIPLEADAKARMKQGIKNRLSGECPDGGSTIRASITEWFALNDKISIKILHQDHEKKIQTAIWKLKPGAVITAHRHSNDEECLVLEGSVNIGNHTLHAGDYHIMNQGSYHSDLSSEHGALLFLKHDMHEHLTGPDACQ